MTEVVKGWGVHLATCEITEVRILSGSLFQDLQANFIAAEEKKAIMEKREVQHQILKENVQYRIEEHERNQKNYLHAVIQQNKVRITEAKAKIETLKHQHEISKNELARKHHSDLRTTKNSTRQKLAADQEKIRKEQARVDYQLKIIQEERAKQRIQQEINRKDEEARIELEKAAAESKIKLAQEQFDLLKKSFQDPIQVKLQKMKTVEQIYKGAKWEDIKLNQVSSQHDPIQEIVDKFTKVVE